MSRLSGEFRRRLLVRLDGAGFSHDLLEHIATGGGTKGRRWELSMGWSCTDTEMDAITRVPKHAWRPGIDQNGELVPDTFVADLSGLLDLHGWAAKIPGLRIVVRDEPLHPRYRKRATDREKQLGRRYQLIATNTRTGQVAWLDAAPLPRPRRDDVKTTSPSRPAVGCATPHSSCCGSGCCTCRPGLTRGQRKRRLHLRADWPWTPELLHAWTAVNALTAT